MAFSNARKKFPKGTHQRSTDSRGGREVWIIDSDTDNENLADAEDAAGIPSLGQSFPGDFNLQVADKDTVQINKRTFEVTVVYAARQDGEDSSEDDPLQQPAQITFSSVGYQEPADTDIHDNPVATENDEPFDPPLMIDKNDLLVSITRNMASFIGEQILYKVNTVNSDEFLGFPPHSCRIVGIRGTKVTTRTPFYYKVSVDIQVRSNPDPGNGWAWLGWRKRVLHQGFKVWDGTLNADFQNNIVHAVDGNKKRVTEPVHLDTEGQETDADGATWLVFEFYAQENFAALNLSQTLDEEIDAFFN